MRAKSSASLTLAAGLPLASNLNNLIPLLTTLRTSSDETELRQTVLGLIDFFVAKLQATAFLVSVADEATTDAQLRAWLRSVYATFLDSLRSLLTRADVPAAAQLCALDAVMQCVRHEQGGCFANELYAGVLTRLVCSATFSSELLSALAARYLGLADVRFYTHTALRQLCEKGCMPDASHAAPAAQEDILRNVYDVLSCLPPRFEAAGDGDDVDKTVPASWCPVTISRKRSAAGGAQLGKARWADAAAQRRAFSSAWLSFLRNELPLDVYKKTLARLHAAVLPHLVNPLLLSDFLTKAVNLGSLLGMLALNGMFVLMTQHGLEYSHFYTRLYGLLEPGIFHARHRRQFFELLAVFLRSTHLPAYLVAAFAKRLARLALSAPPHGAMLATGFAHNLLRRHPGCLVLVQRERGGSAAGDPFLPEESDPAQAQALASSLWELDSLRSHYTPAVARFVAILDRDLSNKQRTADVDVAALAGASYASLFAEEAERRLKAVPLAFYSTEEPHSLWHGWADSA